MNYKEPIIIGVVGDNSGNSFLGRNLYIAYSKKPSSGADIYSTSYPSSNKYTYTCYDFPLNINENIIVAGYYLKKKSYIILVFNDNDPNGLGNLKENLVLVKKINPEAKIIIVKNIIHPSSSQHDESANAFATSEDLELLEVSDEKSSNAVFTRIAELENKKNYPDGDFYYSINTQSAVAKIKYLRNENLACIAQKIEEEKNSANHRDLYDYDTINSALKTLQYVSIINSLENVITNALLIMFIFVTFPFINSLYERNLTERGDKNLFWADAPKQAAEVAINLANADLEHKRR